MSMDTATYRKTVVNILIAAIRNKDSNSITCVRSKAIAVIGYEDYARLYRQAFNLANTRDYKFVSFDAKVIPKPVDKSYVGSEIAPSHNED